MKLFIKKYSSFFILIVFTIILLFAYYGEILLHPNNYFFTNNDDGMKNYYTYAYFIKNGDFSTNFNGMNYPYGEHLQFTDCQPFLAFIVKSFPFLSKNSIGVMNFFMIISLFFTCLLLYLILKKLKINSLLAVFASIAITALAPQLYRLTGHFGLSYSFFIPLTLYLIINYFEAKKRIIWLLLLVLNNLFWFYTHAYLGLMCTMFQSLYFGIEYFWNFKTNYKKISNYLFPIIIVLFPLIIFRLFLFLTDTHDARIENPSGFFGYAAELDDIFIPHYPHPIYLFLEKYSPIVPNLKWEAWSYVGLTTIVVLIFSLIKLIIKIIKKDRENLLSNKTLSIIVISAVFLLLFALSIPFRQLPFLLDWFPFIKQFRATGRFTWFFFFAISIFSIFTINNIFNSLIKSNKKILAYFLIIIALLLYILEGSVYHNYVSQEIKKSENYFNTKLISKDIKEGITNIDISKYQAIIALPFYHTGSETFGIPSKKEISKISMIISYYTGMKMVNSMLSRTSIYESKNIISLISPDYYDKKIKNDINSKKPFLLICSNEDLSQYEQKILNKSNLIYKNKSLSLYSLSYKKLFQNSAQEEINYFEKKKNNLFLKQNFYVSDTLNFLYYNNFDNKKSNFVFRGAGAFEITKPLNKVFVDFPPNTFDTKKEYTASIWMYNNLDDALNKWLRFMVLEYDAQNNKWIELFCLPEYCGIIKDNWSLVELDFKIKNTNNSVSIVVKAKQEILYVDELLIREKNNAIYKVLKKNSDNKTLELFKNNHQIIINK